MLVWKKFKKFFQFSFHFRQFLAFINKNVKKNLTTTNADAPEHEFTQSCYLILSDERPGDLFGME